MHTAYYQTDIPNVAILARAELGEQLKQLYDNYQLLTELIKKYYPSNKKEKAKIFIAQMFLGGSYEFIKSFLGKSNVEQRRLSSSLFNFVYHSRNAAFHGNKFTFNSKSIEEFKNGLKAEWRSYSIAEKDQQTFLFPDKLKVEDVTFLLEDVITLF